MPIHSLLNDHISALQKEFAGSEEGVADTLVLSSSALTRACGVALLKQARWSVREASHLVALSDALYSDVRQIIRRQQKDSLPTGYSTLTSAGRALDVSTDVTIASAASARNSRKEGSGTGDSTVSIPTLPVGMRLAKIIVVDAILQETPELVVTTLRSLERHTGVRLVLVYVADERPSGGLGYRLHSTCRLSEGELYDLGFDLVIQHCLDYSTVRMLTNIFVPHSKQFERGVIAGGSRFVTGNYAKIRHILGEVTDRSGAKDVSPAAAGGTHQCNQIATATHIDSPPTRGMKSAMRAAETVGSTALDCLDTHPDYLKMLARYEHSLSVIESLQKGLSTGGTGGVDRQAELDQTRGELAQALSKIELLTTELEELRKSELLVDQAIHTANRVRDAHIISTLQTSLATFKEKLAVAREENGIIVAVEGALRAENADLREHLQAALAAQQTMCLSPSRRVSEHLFARPTQQIVSRQSGTINRQALADFSAQLEQANLNVRDIDAVVTGTTFANVSSVGTCLTFADIANRHRSVASSTTHVATQTPAVSWIGAIPLSEVETYLQIPAGSLERTATTTETLDAVTQHIVSHLTATLADVSSSKGEEDAFDCPMATDSRPPADDTRDPIDLSAVVNHGQDPHPSLNQEAPWSPPLQSPIHRRDVSPRASVWDSAGEERPLNPPPPLPAASASRFVLRQSLRQSGRQ